MQLKQLNINEVKPNPFQPREKFGKEELQELADNISKHGLIEPIVVTKKKGKYLIVAGERRWRANKLAKQNKVYAIVKDYKQDSDIKRDSLVENEMREDLKHNEFKAFVFSLAKSLGKPYFNKGYIDSSALSKYILGRDKSSKDDSPLSQKIRDLLFIEQRASPKVKKLLETERMDRRTATTLSSIPNKSIQNELADLSKHKSNQDIRREVTKYNFEQQAKVTKETVKKEEGSRSELALISKITTKANSWDDNVNFASHALQQINNKSFLNKLSHESKMDLLDSLKPFRRDVEKLLHIITKIMEGL